MRWEGEMTVKQCDFDPYDGGVELCLRDKNAQYGDICLKDIAECEVRLMSLEGVEVRADKLFRVTVEEVEG